MANLIPANNNKKSGAIIKSDKFFASSNNKLVPSIKKLENKDSKEDLLLTIEKKVIKIDKLLKDSFAFKKKQAEKARVSQEKKSFEKRESELEKKKPKTEKGIKLPSAPRMGFLDWIKNFITQTFLGFIAVRLIDFLPTLLKIYPVIISAGEFLIDVGGNLLNSLVTFVDWGYKAIDGTRQFIKNIGGAGWAQNFDKFAGAIDNLIEVAVIAAIVTAGSGDGFGGGRVDPKRGFDTKGRRVGVDTQRRYAQRFGRDQFVDRFGKGNLGNLQGGVRRGAFQQGARNAFVGLAGKGGAKSILKFVRPLTKRIPIIGGLLDFGLSVALGEDPGRAAFKAIGATLVGAVGAAIGSLAFGVGGIIGGIIGGIGGDALGGALYDMIFKNKKPTPKKGKSNKLAGGGAPMTRSPKSSTSTPRRTLKKKKVKRSLSFVPIKIKPGRSAGGEDKIQKVFPNPEKPKSGGFFGWLGGLFGGNRDQTQQTQEVKPKQQKPKQKVANPQEFLVKSNEVLGRSPNFGPFFTLALKTVLGDTPNWLDYLNVGRGLNSWIQEIFATGSLGFSGGGEVDARQFFQGEDYTNVVAKSVKDSVSKDVDRTIRNLKDELALRPVGREEMIQENIKGAEEEGVEEFGGGFDEAGISSSEMDLFIRMVYAEAGGEGKTGMALVARAILNRAGLIQSGKVSPGTFNSKSGSINDVIRAPKQFSPMTDGRINQKLTESQINQAKSAIKLAQNPKELMSVLKSEGLDDSTIKKLIAVTGFRNYSAGAGYDPSQDVNEVRYKRHTFNTAGNKSLIVPKSVAVQDDVTPITTETTKGYKVTRSGRTIKNYSELPPHHTYQTTADGRRVQDFTLYKGNQFVNVPVPSPVTGKVTWTGNAGGGGKWVEIQSKEGKVELGHFNRINVKPNQSVQAFRTILGLQGYTGNISPPGPDGTHVHIQAPDRVISRYVNTLAKFHGGVGIVPKGGMMLKLHEGEMFKVVDKDSVDLFGRDLIQDVIDIENKSQLIAKAPSIIEKLKSISNYTDEELETQIIVMEVPTPPEIIPIGSSGNTNIFVGGVNSNMASFDMEQKLSQIG